MKLIMEGWRKFVNESWTADYSLDTLGMFAEQTSVGIKINLVDVASAQMPETPMVVGMIETSDTDKPCIPNTHEIGAVAIHPSALKKGIGTYLYEVASLFVLKNFNGGITSDHMSSTTKPAARVWNKLEDKFGYIKRKTKPGKEEYNDDGEIVGGSDTLDYGGATPDPNDDCTNVVSGKAATDHSLQIPPERISFVESMMEKQMNNFSNYLRNYDGDWSDLYIRQEISKEADRLFNAEYRPEKLGIHGEEE